MKWVTWENIGVDRMACGWLIRKFIDPSAEIVFIPMGQKTVPEGAEPFDIPGVRLSHHQGHCTFHAMLREYQLADPVLQRIARIVEAAAPGLDLICRGLRLTSPDDVVALERGALIYDALYAQLRLEILGSQ